MRSTSSVHATASEAVGFCHRLRSTGHASCAEAGTFSKDWDYRSGLYNTSPSSAEDAAEPPIACVRHTHGKNDDITATPYSNSSLNLASMRTTMLLIMLIIVMIVPAKINIISMLVMTVLKTTWLGKAATAHAASLRVSSRGLLPSCLASNSSGCSHGRKP